MAITNFEHSIRTMVLFWQNKSQGQVLVRQINTGSYVYSIVCVYNINEGFKYIVNKTKCNGQNIGNIAIDKISIYGMEYDNSKGSLPDSVTIEIMTFHKELMRRTGNYK